MKEAYNNGEKPPKLTFWLSKEHDDRHPTPEWSKDWENTLVPVERVIAYWSCVLLPVETHYLATEHEALVAKESLVCFQPFIEGERVLLVTDHATLIWAKMYENANRRLAAWGLIFAAFPQMVIVHRPGRVHSNVDPLSRLPRIPIFTSPARDDLPDAKLTTEHVDLWKAWETFIKECKEAVEAQAAVAVPQQGSAGVSVHVQKGSLHIYADPKVVQHFREGYKKDKTFSAIEQWMRNEEPIEGKYRTYRLGENGLLYFEDADYRIHLCIPKSERSVILQEVYDRPHEGAHAGWEWTLAILWEKYYWPRMRKDDMDYVCTCDPCQKIKHDCGAKVGYLQPLEIPFHPFDVISLDLITGLPKLQGKDAILVVVDKLTKFAHFIGTTMDMMALVVAGLLFT